MALEFDDVRFINPLGEDGSPSPRTSSSSPAGLTPRSPAYVEGSDMLQDHHVAEFECHLSEDDISDLTYAFQACDADRGGTIDGPELYAMLDVLGATVTPEMVDTLFKHAKEDFFEWRQDHDDNMVLPGEMQYNEDDAGHLDDTRHGGERHYHTLAIDKANRSLGPGFQSFKDHKVVQMVGKPIAIVGKPVYTAGKAVTKTAINTTRIAAGYLYKGASVPVDYTGKLLDISYSLMTSDNATLEAEDEGLSAQEQKVRAHFSLLRALAGTTARPSLVLSILPTDGPANSVFPFWPPRRP